MILVIDANPLIAGFLRKSISRHIILSENILLYSPQWLIEEFDRNEPELAKKFSSSENFFETKKILFSFVRIIPEDKYSIHIEEASKLAKHTKDIPYFALALHLNCAIWSDEKSFKQQSKIKIYSTSDLIKELVI